MPSSDQIDCTSRPSDSRSRAPTAIAHGACTRAPNGVRMQMRQSPISSRNRSTTTVRSDGSAPVARSCSRRKAIEVPLRPLVEIRHLRVARREQLARELADRLAELVRPADALALPERHRARYARRRRDEHAVAGDLLDPPGRGAEHDHLARARLVDHLLVELAHATRRLRAGDEDAEEAAVGDRAGVRDGEPPRARPPAEDARGAIPDDARPQLGELVRRVAAGEHVEDVLELRAREVGEGIGAAHELVQLGDLDLLVGADRDDVLGEDVERVARDLRLLDQPLPHPLRDDRRLEQVGAELREDPPARDLAERVAGAADPLQAARDRLRRLDLDHEVDGAHVDPELERRGRDEAWDAARLQVLLDLRALLARERAVVRARNLLLRQLVQPQRQPLGEAAVVDEDDRRAVRADELDERRVDRRPDRARLPALLATLAARLAHVLDRDDDLEVELLRDACVDELDRPAARDEAADLLERTLRRREPDSLRRLRRERLEPLDREREMGAALRAGDRVHLVEDQRVDAPQQLACARGEQQEERLRRGDQDVRRLAEHRRALLLRRVARADGDAELRLEARERAAQVPLDVVVERLERRDVEQAEAVSRRRRQAVDRGEERGERLPRAGRRLDEDVPAAGDRRPALRLRRRRRGEVSLEPRTRLGAEGSSGSN